MIWYGIGTIEKMRVSQVWSALCYYILKDKGEVISRTTVQHIPQDDFLKPEVQASVKDYHASLDLFLEQDQYIYAQEDNEFIWDDVQAPIGSGFTEEELGMMLIAMDVDEYVDAENAEAEADTYCCRLVNLLKLIATK